MKLTSCRCLWDVDSIDQFYGTLERINTDARGWSSRWTDRPTNTFVFLHTSAPANARPLEPPATRDTLKEQPMTADPAQPAIRVYQLKIVLRDLSPLVWRRVLVTSETTIAALHAIVQAVMGWEDLHLHQFRIHGKAYGVYRGGGVTFADDPQQVRLSDFRLHKGERFRYDYDFGDYWQHDIRLEQVLPLEAQTPYPVCTAGHGACPPEDCGGPPGYMALLEEQSSWPAVLQAYDDVVLVAERVRTFLAGGPRPTDDDDDFIAALERMEDRLEDAPSAFSRRAVNAALRTMMEGRGHALPDPTHRRGG
jgi:hypothetical protein